VTAPILNRGSQTQGVQPGASTRWPGALIFFMVLFCLAAALVLFFFDPAKFGFYPVCYFHQLTGLLCPGCGGLRALHQLVHGHVGAAFNLNALLVLALPIALWLGARMLVRRVLRQPAHELHARWFWIGLVVMLAFGVLRNFQLSARLKSPPQIRANLATKAPSTWSRSGLSSRCDWILNSGREARKAEMDSAFSSGSTLQVL
jgi:hypothetical protein